MPLYSDLQEKADLLKSGKLSLRENVSGFLTRINDSDLNSFTSAFESESLSRADEISRKSRSGSAGKLAGAVIAVKDVIAIEGKHLTCGSAILKDYISPYNATVIEKLIQEDAIIIGKTNCDEFAMGSSNENSAYGPVKNPLDHDRVPGGSSGGSAAAVAADLCDAALGSDTGGSIRQPAAFCGVWGLKPTYSAVSRYGLTAYASSFDSIGPLAKNLNDLELIFDVISGYDDSDTTSNPELRQNRPSDAPVTIGIPDEYVAGIQNKNLLANLNEFRSVAEKAGHKVISVSLPNTQYAIATYYILACAEASSNLSRYDGVRYSDRKSNGSGLSDMYLTTRESGFGKEVRKRILMGTYVLSSGYYDAYFTKAAKVRRLISNDFSEAFRSCDLILTPTTPDTAFKLGEKINDPLQMYLSDIFTVSVNLAGLPALSFPFGNDSKGLPFGLQIIGPAFSEKTIFSALRNIL
ncbi:MAG: Asp-tRNA(Asn)/Glu-tRNA(Gln) amidotransferase subunit GatA [Ignavibacteriaceae bacterium]|nr:Asp-tRNA(Asn)/Glu-tRNA(Gln) amidotransferase subunit GatA [Ignavibacteriaceae bacterium]